MELVRLLGADSQNIRFASATGLIHFKDSRAIPTLEKMMSISAQSSRKTGSLSEDKVFGLKLNILNGLKKTGWKELASIVENNMKTEKNLKVISLSREILGEIKSN